MSKEPLVPKPLDEDGDGCWNCRYCVEVLGPPSESGWREVEQQECRLNPPVPVLWGPDGQTDCWEPTFGWPDLLCQDSGWCSHHKPRRGDEGRSVSKGKGECS